ncbi:MAG TPA: biotin--[acetyl-CoA-carboxylase] ligase, partial [Chitinophagaceae bacterium]|nr:biotin--[acetyl-CoA-carboxylase] ligase [Chitinophagaceae bacterium]
MPEPSSDTRIGEPFIELLSVDSTNNYALTQVRAGLAQHGTAFFAHEQLAGKGQRGKSWTAAPDSSLILSVVVDPHPLAIGQQFQLSACIALAGLALLRKYAGGNVAIKWPNDLYWRDRKAGGILIENIIGAKTVETRSANEDPSYGEWQWAIVGIGINLNQEFFPEELKNP